MFTDAKTVFINNKEVQSITLQNGETLYEKPSSNAHINQIRLKLRINSNTCYYDEENGYEFNDYNSIANYTDWGDGTSDGNHYHYYAEEGEYDVIMYTKNDLNQLDSEAYHEMDSFVSFDASDCLTLESIGGECFGDCENLESVIFRSTLTSMSYGIVYQCDNVESITFMSTTPPTADWESFDSLPSDCVIYVPQGTLSVYTSAEYYPDPNTYTYTEYSSLSNITGGNE